MNEYYPSALFLLLASSPLRPAASDPDAARRLDSLFETLPYATFEWAKAKGVSERAAIRLPVTLDGTEGYFQLDTGLDVTLLDGDVPDGRAWETHDGMYHVPSFAIGDIDVGPVWVRAREEGDGGKQLGSLGLDLLVGHLVVIDYPGRRFALFKPGEAPAWLWRRTTWTPAVLRDAKLFLYVILGGKGVNDLIFDTGSSAFDIVVDFDEWKELTWLDGPDATTTKKRVNSWGKKITAIGAVAPEPLIIGSARIADPKVYYLEEQPRLFANWPFPAKGLVGNAPFLDRVVILDLGIRPRFGLLE